MADKPSPLSQEYFDENRKLYGAETSEAPNKLEACPHKKEWLVIKGQDVECSHCTAGWPGLAKHFTTLK